MGKKKVAEKSQEEIAKEAESIEQIAAKKISEKAKRRSDSGKIYIQASYNNTIITVTNEKGDVVTWMSAGSLGFSGPKKATPFAASKVAEAIMEKIEKTGPFNVIIIVRGVGTGRDAAIRSFVNRLNVGAVKDYTPVPHNGPRPPKVRRV